MRVCVCTVKSSALPGGFLVLYSTQTVLQGLDQDETGLRVGSDRLFDKVYGHMESVYGTVKIPYNREEGSKGGRERCRRQKLGGREEEMEVGVRDGEKEERKKQISNVHIVYSNMTSLVA